MSDDMFKKICEDTPTKDLIDSLNTSDNPFDMIAASRLEELTKKNEELEKIRTSNHLLLDEYSEAVYQIAETFKLDDLLEAKSADEFQLDLPEIIEDWYHKLQERNKELELTITLCQPTEDTIKSYKEDNKNLLLAVEILEEKLRPLEGIKDLEEFMETLKSSLSVLLIRNQPEHHTEHSHGNNRKLIKQILDLLPKEEEPS